MMRHLDLFLGKGYYLYLFQPPGGGGVSSWITGLKEISMILTGLKVVVFFFVKRTSAGGGFFQKTHTEIIDFLFKNVFVKYKNVFFSPAALIFNWT